MIRRCSATKLVMAAHNVSAAEKLFPACDISEQISLLPKKQVVQVTWFTTVPLLWGTEDGANAETEELL